MYSQLKNTDKISGCIVDTVFQIEAEAINSVSVETHTLFIGRLTVCKTIDDSKILMAYNYCRNVNGNKTPRIAATYIKKKSGQRIKDMKKYKCLMCGYVYDPEIGDPENGVEPGTDFEDLPDDWVCPDCGAGKDEFEPLED